VRFIETVIGEFLHQLENFNCFRLIESLRNSAVDEDFSLRIHLGTNFLAHGTA